MLQTATGLFAAFALSAMLVAVLARAAPRVGLIDAPAGRKTHSAPTPVVGGLGLFLAFQLVAANLVLSSGRFSAFLAGLMIVTATGLVDDAVDLRPRVKLLAVAGAAVVMTTPGLVLATHVGAVGGAAIELGVFALPFTLVMIVGLANAWNMLDGIDGAAGAAAVAALASLCGAAILAGRPDLAQLAGALAAATLGFLVFNIRHPWRARASVFLGDAGSLTLGAAIAWTIAALSTPDRSTGAQALPLVALLWIVCVPAIDTLSLIIRRVAAGRSPMAADREHLHHLLLEAGLSPARAAATIGALVLVGGALGVGAAALGVPDGITALGLLVPIAVHVAFVDRVTRRRATMSGAAARVRAGQRMEPGSYLPGRPDIPAGPER